MINKLIMINKLMLKISRKRKKETEATSLCSKKRINIINKFQIFQLTFICELVNKLELNYHERKIFYTFKYVFNSQKFKFLDNLAEIVCKKSAF